MISWGSSALTGTSLVSGACLTLFFFATLRLCVRICLSRKDAKTQREDGDVAAVVMALFSWGSSALTGIVLVSGACLRLFFFATLREDLCATQRR